MGDNTSAAGPVKKKARFVAPDAQCKAGDVMKFRLVESKSRDELEAEIVNGGKTFEGEFFHQHFDEEEEIHGYVDLRISVWISAQTFHTWIDISFKTKRLNPTKLHDIFKETFPSGYFKRKEDFINAVVSEDMSELLASGEAIDEMLLKNDQKVVIRKFKLVEATQPIQDLHKRMEPFNLFFIDAASFLEVDERWSFMLPILSTAKGQLIMGHQCVCTFWAYPSSSRSRLSQILILPPYQGLGVGRRLVSLVYKLAQQEAHLDVTFEDPTPNITRVRERLELQMLLDTLWAVEMADQCLSAAGVVKPSESSAGTFADQNAPAPDGNVLAADQPSGKAKGKGPSTSTLSLEAELREGVCTPLNPPPAFIARATSELKIHKKQASVVWEPLLMARAALQPGGPTALAPKLLIYVTGRLRTTHLASCRSDAESKEVVDDPENERNFVMMKCSKRKGASSAEAGASAEQANGSTDAPAMSSRMRVEDLSPEQRAEMLSNLVAERWARISELVQT